MLGKVEVTTPVAEPAATAAAKGKAAGKVAMTEAAIPSSPRAHAGKVPTWDPQL
jgi:hypothetical protein